MASFSIECPHCGTLNKASTFIFAKKVISCGNCHKDINIKANRLTSRKCPHCDNVFVYDQAKGKSVCPVCHKNIEPGHGKLVSFPCPQCSCIIQFDKNTSDATCPVCNHHIEDVTMEMSKASLVTDSSISVIKYEGDNSTFVWKHPIEDFNFGSQLIVHESQEAIFFLNGQALDLFGPGRHTLETGNLPILKKAYNLPTGNQSLFHAEVYFVNKTVQMGIKWGTDSRVRFIEPNTGIPLDIGASGEMSLQVGDSRKLLVKLVGTTGGLTRNQILSATPKESDLVNEAQFGNDNSRNLSADAINGGWANALKGYFRPLVMTAVKSYLASTIKSEKINILEIDEKLSVLSDALRERITAGFEEYGLFVPNLYVTNVSLPEDDKNFKKIRELLAATYLGVKEAEVEANIIAARRKKMLEEQETLKEQARMEAQRKRIVAEGEAEAMRVKGMTDIELKKQMGLGEAEVMRAKGYNEKDVLQSEVQKAYAEGIGNMGSGSGSGAGGGMMSDILGLGVGLAAANTMGAQVNEAFKSFSETKSSVSNEDHWRCSCGFDKNIGNFCSSCGKAKPVLWDCPLCGAKGNNGKFCSGCGNPKQELWDCPHCGAKGNKGKFCSECGKGKEAQETWDCSCGNKGITGKFCSECGRKRESSDTWDCTCGNKGIKGKFCSECGKKKEDINNE